MKKDDFDKACGEVPIYMARFRITNVSGWQANCGVKKGDFYLYCGGSGHMVPEKVGQYGVSPSASNFEFAGYVQVRRADNRFEVVGVHP